MRSDPQRYLVRDFIRNGAIGKNIMARAQWHKKESWRRVSPNPEREKEINWRLRKENSPGLMGEIGLHQLDLVQLVPQRTPGRHLGFRRDSQLERWPRRGRHHQAVVEYPQQSQFYLRLHTRQLL